MNIFSQKPEGVATQLGFPLLGPSGHEELFADINRYIGLQTIDNEVLRKSIEKVLHQLEESYVKLQKLAQKNSLSGENTIHVKCSGIVDILLTSYLKDDSSLSQETPRSLLKQTEMQALYKIIGNTFGRIQQIGGTLSIDRNENTIIVALPYITQEIELGNQQTQFWYHVSLAICNKRKEIAHNQIDTLLDKIEKKLAELTKEKYKKEIGGIFGMFQSLVKPSRSIKISESTAVILKKHFSRATGGLPHSQNEIEEYHAYLDSKLSILNKEYGCKFIFETTGSHDEYYQVSIQPDRSMDNTELISQ